MQLKTWNWSELESAGAIVFQWDLMQWLFVLISQYLESCAARALWAAKNRTISWTDWSYSDGEKLSWNENLEKNTGWMEWMLELSTGAFRGGYLPYSVNPSLLIFVVFTAAPFPKSCGKLRASSELWSQRVWVKVAQVPSPALLFW